MNSTFELLREIFPKDSVMFESYVDAKKPLPHVGLDNELLGVGVNILVMQEP